MNTDIQAENLLSAWVKISSIMKTSRLTHGLPYNESIVMLLLYKRYLADGTGYVSIKEIIEETNMLKSLANRTVNALEKKGLLVRCEVPGDKRLGHVRCVPEKLSVFLDVHNSSLSLARHIIELIGKEDTDAFTRLVSKMQAAKFKLPPGPDETHG